MPRRGGRDFYSNVCGILDGMLLLDFMRFLGQIDGVGIEYKTLGCGLTFGYIY